MNRSENAVRSVVGSVLIASFIVLSQLFSAELAYSDTSELKKPLPYYVKEKDTTYRPNERKRDKIVCVVQPSPQSEIGFTAKPRVWKVIETDNCQTQNDGSTWCDFYDCDDDGVCIFLTHACHSKYNGDACEGDEVEDCPGGTCN